MGNGAFQRMTKLVPIDRRLLDRYKISLEFVLESTSAEAPVSLQKPLPAQNIIRRSKKGESSAPTGNMRTEASRK
jgi:hypothetical protein